MTRNRKIRGLAVVGAFALGALAMAATAQAANGRITSTGAVTLTGTDNTAFKVTAFGITVECPGTTYTGHRVGSTTLFLPSGSEEATITPKFNQPCKSNVGPSMMEFNGCDFVNHLGETNGVADTYRATYDLVCPAGKDVTIKNWFSEAEQIEEKEACTLHLAPQTGLLGGTDKDTTKGDLELNGPIVGVKVVETKDNLHALLCPAKSGTGEFDINITVKGMNESMGDTSVSLSHL